MHKYLIALGVSFLVSYFITPVVRWLGVKMNVMDQPGHRKIHKVPKPRFGGAGLAVAILVAFYVCHRLGFFAAAYRNEFRGLLIGGSIVFAIGLIDDFVNLRSWIKLAVQIFAAIILVNHGVMISLFIHNPVLSGIVTVIWIVAITNSFNLLDNMDGLSAGVGAVSCLMFVLVYQRQGLESLNTFLFILMGSLIGFLRYNFYPSSVIMGDSGALLLGFLIGGTSSMGTYLRGSLLTHLPVITPVLILGVPIFDTVSVVIIRLRQRVSIFTADMNHFSHRLVRLGMNQPQAVLFIYLVSFCAGITSRLLPHVGREDAAVLLVQALCVFAIIVFLMFTTGEELKRRIGNKDKTPGE